MFDYVKHRDILVFFSHVPEPQSMIINELLFALRGMSCVCADVGPVVVRQFAEIKNLCNELTWTFRPRRTAKDLESRRDGSSWGRLIQLIKL